MDLLTPLINLNTNHDIMYEIYSEDQVFLSITDRNWENYIIFPIISRIRLFLIVLYAYIISKLDEFIVYFTEKGLIFQFDLSILKSLLHSPNYQLILD